MRLLVLPLVLLACDPAPSPEGKPASAATSTVSASASAEASSSAATASSAAPLTPKQQKALAIQAMLDLTDVATARRDTQKSAADRELFELRSSEVYDEKTDPNELLGRPGQYIAKMNWKCLGGDATVEVFLTAEDANARAEYIRALGKTPMFLVYVFVNEKRRMVLRLPKSLTPAQADEWKTVLASL